MLKLGVVSLLFLQYQAQNPTLTPSSEGQFHASADDYGQVYWVNNEFTPTKIGPPMDQVGSSHKIPAYPSGRGATFLAVAASNNGPWTNPNKASIILSTNPKATIPRIVTDASWKCNKYDNGGFSQDDWPGSSSAQAAVTDAARKYDTTELLPAVDLSYILHYIPIKRIQLGAKFIWYGGLGSKDILPAENVVCLIKLA